MAGQTGGAHHAHDATRRPGQNGILALKQPRIGKPAIRLHEHQALAGAVVDIEFVGDLIHIAAQDRRQIGVHDGRVAA